MVEYGTMYKMFQKSTDKLWGMIIGWKITIEHGVAIFVFNQNTKCFALIHFVFAAITLKRIFRRTLLVTLIQLIFFVGIIYLQRPFCLWPDYKVLALCFCNGHHSYISFSIALKSVKPYAWSYNLKYIRGFNFALDYQKWARMYR